MLFEERLLRRGQPIGADEDDEHSEIGCAGADNLDRARLADVLRVLVEGVQGTVPGHKHAQPKLDRIKPDELHLKEERREDA